MAEVLVMREGCLTDDLLIGHKHIYFKEGIEFLIEHMPHMIFFSF